MHNSRIFDECKAVSQHFGDRFSSTSLSLVANISVYGPSSLLHIKKYILISQRPDCFYRRFEALHHDIAPVFQPRAGLIA